MRTKQYKAGEVVSIRVNPRDCMSCIDIVQKLGLSIQGSSFSTVVSAALASALETLRQNNIVPTRDGFEYNDLMSAFPKTVRASRSRALAITKTFELAGGNGQVPAVAPNFILARKQRRFKELAFKSNHDEQNMSAEEKAELAELVLELNPL